MKIKNGNSAVSEIIGAIVLLAMAVVVFSVIYINVLSDDGPNPNAFLTVIGKIDDNNVTFDHSFGENISIDSPIILTIGGQPIENIEGKPYDKVRDFLSFEFKLDGIWNIGEQLFYHPSQDISTAEIKAYIFDEYTNDMVFWGTLQEGYVASPFGRGGLWHFDELKWNSAPEEVKDSSCNDNHGTARNGAKIVLDDNDPKTDDPVIGNCGYFDGINDKVEVECDYSLNITRAITIEAWVNPEKETSVISDIIIESLKFGFNPDLIHIHGDTYAVAARDEGGQGGKKPLTVFTFNVSSDDGTISMLDPSIPNNNTIFTNYDADKPDILQHAQNNSLYLIAYENASTTSAGVICTINISYNGSIKELGSSFYVVFTENNEKCFDPMLIHVSNNIYAIVYHSGVEKDPGIGKLVTISVDTQGSIRYITTSTFNTSGCKTPHIVHVSGDIYAIAYEGVSSKGVITIVNISSNGESITKIQDFIFDNTFCMLPHFINVSGDVYAIAYQATGGNPGSGVLITISISPDGSLISIIDDFTFTNTCFEVTLTHYINTQYFLIYTDDKAESGSAKGYLRTVKIENNGSIIDAKEEWEPEELATPMGVPSDVLHVSGRIFLFGYAGHAEGHGHPMRIMSLQIGTDSTPIQERGIVRAGAATLYAQYPRGSGSNTIIYIYGCINDPSNLFFTQVNTDEWHHIALTYDCERIHLYVDGLEKINISYSEPINIPQNNLLFGNIFHGLIDEIVIFDRVLPLNNSANPTDSIWYHYQHPEILYTYNCIK